MEIIKAANDHRDYTHFLLLNQLEVVFIHDPKASISSVSLSVGTGSYDDEIEGIAHFLEHMLFMGNEKYPEEKYYFTYISSHGGYCNAYTAGDHTNYYYTIESGSLIKSLDIFSGFFICPLFSQSSLDREMNAVDSEHKKNILDDNWRNFQMIKTICKESSPMAKFSTGNLDTLNIPNIRNIVMKFYEKNYSSNIMKLVVLFNGDNIECANIIESIQKYFSIIKNNNLLIKRHHDHDMIDCKKIIKIIPIQDHNMIILVFQINYNNKIKNNNLLEYISYLINHQGENSFYDYLYKRGIIEEMVLYEESNFDDYSLLSLKIKLNDIKNLDIILQAYDRYINILLESIYDKKILLLLKESNFLKSQQFNNFEISDEGDFVSNISSNLLLYSVDRKYLLKYNYLIANFIAEEELLEELLNILISMTLDNNNYSILEVTKNNNTDNDYLTEKYYGIKYKIEPLIIKKDIVFNGLLAFPKLNKYIVCNKKLINGDTDSIPIVIKMSNNICAYLKQNYDYKTTECQLYIQVSKDNIYNSIINYIKYMYFCELFYLVFNNIIYEMIGANFLFSFNINRSNYTVYLYGYYENISIILQELIKRMKKLNKYITYDLFKIIKTKLLNDYKNKKYSAPHKKIFELEEEIIMDKYFSYQQIEKELLKLDYGFIEEICKLDLFITNKIIIYCEGNINKTTYNEILNIVSQNYNFIEKNPEEYNLNIEKIKEINSLVVKNDNLQESNDCVLLDIFISNIYKDSNWINDYCCLLIFDMIVSNEFFDKLRTKEQLGYIVKTKISIKGFCNKQFSVYQFLVQSSVKLCDYLEKRILKFIKKEISGILKEVTSENLLEIIDSIKETLDKPFGTLTESASFMFDKITNKNFIYNFNKIISGNITEITLDKLNLFYSKYFSDPIYTSIKLSKV